MEFDHHRDDTGRLVRHLEATLAIFGLILLAAAVVTLTYCHS